MFGYKVAEPNEALLVSGLGIKKTDEVDFKIIVGKGCLVLPLQKARRLDLSAHETELSIECVTQQGIKVGVKAVVVYKVGDDLGSIANAARRFLDQEDQMDTKVHNVFAGHLRSIVGSMTVEQIIRERDKLASQTRESSATEMTKLGLVIDSLQIQELEDPSGYIDNLAKPHQAAVEKEARIAAADADREATEREQEANAKKAAAVSTSEIAQADAAAQAQKAQATASQAGPLAEAQAKKAVVEQETEVAKLNAAKVESELQAEVVKRAQADRDAQILKAEADAKRIELAASANAAKVKIEAQAQAEATTLTGQADGEAAKARGIGNAEARKAEMLAEAEGLSKRADALAKNQDAVINQQIAEKLPEIVKAAASAFENIGDLTVLNGGEGINQMVGQVIGTGLAAVPMLKKLLTSFDSEGQHGNGAVGSSAAEKVIEAKPVSSASVDEQA